MGLLGIMGMLELDLGIEMLPGQQRQEGLGQQEGEMIERRAQVKDQLYSKGRIPEAWGVLRRREITRRALKGMKETCRGTQRSS